MRYFNTSDVNSFKRQMNFESYDLSKAASYKSKDVFLSHSSKDKDSLPSVISFLKQYDVNVYIDKTDEKLPNITSPETGQRLKSRIQQCRKFIVLVSDNSKESKWIPWELGIADEKKSLSNIALLPIVQTSTNPSWPKQEYMGIYPRIINNTFKGESSPVWMVLDHHNNNGTELGKWLKS